MKYITTDTHPELKEGIIIYKGISDYRSDFFMSLCNTFNIKTWEAQGYIKEVEEKEWTNSDMQSYAEWFKRCTGAKDAVAGDHLKIWIALESRKEDK